MADVVVERAGPGVLDVRWTLDHGDAAVDIAVGPTPESVDHAHAHTVEAGRTATRIEGLDHGRHYVSVSPAGEGGAVVAAERRVPFEGTTNFRDLGGYRATGGARTRWGLLFRSDALHSLTAADLVLYERLGLRVVYDLRGDTERAELPNPVPTRSLSIFDAPRQPRPPDFPPREPAPRPQTAQEGQAFLLGVYLRMLRDAGPLFGELIGSLLDHDGVPVVFHCANGKDRTGLTAALLLELFGVARDDVLEDYELTARFRVHPADDPAVDSFVKGGMGRAAAEVIMGAPRAVMARTLEELDATYGGVEAYLTGPAGLTSADLESLRSKLLR